MCTLPVCPHRGQTAQAYANELAAKLVQDANASLPVPRYLSGPEEIKAYKQGHRIAEGGSVQKALARILVPKADIDGDGFDVPVITAGEANRFVAKLNKKQDGNYAELIDAEKQLASILSNNGYVYDCDNTYGTSQCGDALVKPTDDAKDIFGATAGVENDR